MKDLSREPPLNHVFLIRYLRIDYFSKWIEFIYYFSFFEKWTTDTQQEDTGVQE
jgi:hypothetical protein